MKKIFVIMILILNQNIYANSCMKEYKNRVDKIKTYYSGVNGGDLLYTSIVGGSTGFMASGGVLGLLDLIIRIAASSGTSLIPVATIATGVGIGIPVVLTTGYAVDTISDAPFVKMMKIIERANIEAGTVSDEIIRTDFRNKIPVDGVTRDEIRRQRNYNRNAQRHNRELEKLNKRISSRIEKRKRAFDDLISELEKIRGTRVSREDVARLVVDADTQEKLCNSEIRLLGNDLTLRTDYIRVTGETAIERMKQRSHNRKIERHNDKIAKLIKRKDLAKIDHLLKYLDDQLTNH